MNEPKVIVVIKVLKITYPKPIMEGGYCRGYIDLTKKLGDFLRKVNVGDLLYFEHPFVYHSNSMQRNGFHIKITNFSTMKSDYFGAKYLDIIWKNIITEYEQIEL